MAKCGLGRRFADPKFIGDSQSKKSSTERGGREREREPGKEKAPSIDFHASIAEPSVYNHQASGHLGRRGEYGRGRGRSERREVLLVVRIFRGDRLRR